jgi:uncharacterized protein (UPF0332 family)
MDEIKSLLKKAKDSIEAAGILLERRYYGFAASRVYYAMFYIAEALLLEKGLTFSTHKGVRSAFGKEFVKTGIMDRKFGKGLGAAYRLRENGDYEPQDKVSKEDVEEMLRLAKEFLEAARRYLDEIK